MHDIVFRERKNYSTLLHSSAYFFYTQKICFVHNAVDDDDDCSKTFCVSLVDATVGSIEDERQRREGRREAIYFILKIHSRKNINLSLR